MRELRRSRCYEKLRLVEPRMADRTKSSLSTAANTWTWSCRSRWTGAVTWTLATRRRSRVFSRRRASWSAAHCWRWRRSWVRARDAPSFPSAACITPRARTRRGSACSMTAVSRSNYCAVVTGCSASHMWISMPTTAMVSSTASNPIQMPCLPISTKTAVTSIRARARKARPGRVRRWAPSSICRCPPGRPTRTSCGVAQGRAIPARHCTGVHPAAVRRRQPGRRPDHAPGVLGGGTRDRRRVRLPYRGRTGPRARAGHGGWGLQPAESRPRLDARGRGARRQLIGTNRGHSPISPAAPGK
jgi:hypothetical protein